MGCWRSLNCCIGEYEKATQSEQARCHECQNVKTNWKRMLENHQKKKSTIATINLIQPQNKKQVLVDSMMQDLRTLLEADSISETDKITIAKQLVQDSPYPSMTETPIRSFQTDNRKKRKKITLCADRGKSSDCCGISIFERQSNEPKKFCTYCLIRAIGANILLGGGVSAYLVLWIL